MTSAQARYDEERTKFGRLAPKGEPPYTDLDGLLDAGDALREAYAKTLDGLKALVQRLESHGEGCCTLDARDQDVEWLMQHVEAIRSVGGSHPLTSSERIMLTNLREELRARLKALGGVLDAAPPKDTP